jgi:hypothetical protein
LDSGDYKRRDKLVQKKGRALSIFEETKIKLEEVADNLDNEAIECDKLIMVKKEEIVAQEKNAKEARDECSRINTTCAKLGELLGVDLPEKA